MDMVQRVEPSLWMDTGVSSRKPPISSRAKDQITAASLFLDHPAAFGSQHRDGLRLPLYGAALLKVEGASALQARPHPRRPAVVHPLQVLISSAYTWHNCERPAEIAFSANMGRQGPPPPRLSAATATTCSGHGTTRYGKLATDPRTSVFQWIHRNATSAA